MSQVGHKQLFPNVIASGIAYIVAVGIGFIMPRLIYETVGQVSLGLWDLGWSFLVYVTFSGIGYGPAIAYYTASYHATGDDAFLAELNATGIWCQVAFAFALTLLFISGFNFISHATNLLDPQDSNSLWGIGVFLGLTVGLIVIGDAGHGALVGNHKARIAEYINTVHDISLAIAMVCVLLLGHGVVALAVATFSLRVCTETVRFWFVRRCCPEFQIAPALFSFPVARKLTRYAIKTSAAVFQELLVFQTARLVLFLSAGPVALAAFSRYATIARQINRFIDRLSISIPTVTSGFFAEGNHERISTLYLNGARGGMLLTLPILSIFGVFGDSIVNLWMGPEFVVRNISWIFAAGALLHANYAICNRILSGINAHGRVTLACLTLSGFVLLVACLITYPQDLFEAALLITCVMLFTVHLPYILFACWKLSITVADVIANVYLWPVLLNLAFLAVLFCAKLLGESGFSMTAYLIIIVGAIALAFCYWFLAVNKQMKEELLRVLKLGNARASS